jgi:hypothetical protein
MLFTGELTGQDKLVYVNHVLRSKLLESATLQQQAANNPDGVERIRVGLGSAKARRRRVTTKTSTHLDPGDGRLARVLAAFPLERAVQKLADNTGGIPAGRVGLPDVADAAQRLTRVVLRFPANGNRVAALSRSYAAPSGPVQRRALWLMIRLA